MEVSFNELRCKEVVNLTDGKRLGHICDIILSSVTKTVLGLVVPGERKIFQAKEDIFIPWRNINKIGDDVILINIDLNGSQKVTRNNNHNADSGEGDFIDV
jgi:YlmC/YmxH family sporulation protein